MFFAPSKSRRKAKIWNMGVSKTIDQDQDARPQSGASSILQSTKLGLKGHRCSLHLQNQDRELKFGLWVNQRPVTTSNEDQDAKPKFETN